MGNSGECYMFPNSLIPIWATYRSSICQLLEDSAVLVFLQDQLEHFAMQHAGYTREKFVDILKK
jgi:hypothetical protein